LLGAKGVAVGTGVTVGGFGTEAGAVYITVPPIVPESVPQAAFVQPAPESVHDAPLLVGSFETVAVKLVAWLASTVTVPGESVTDKATGCGAGLVDDPPPHPPKITTANMHALIAATLVRSTPREKTINPPEKRSGTDRHSNMQAFPDSRRTHSREDYC